MVEITCTEEVDMEDMDDTVVMATMDEEEDFMESLKMKDE